MATEPVKCLLCKEPSSNEVPFLNEDACTCCIQGKIRIHIRCAKIYCKLNISIKTQYAPDYKMCEICTNVTMPTYTKYSIGDKIFKIYTSDHTTYIYDPVISHIDYYRRSIQLNIYNEQNKSTHCEIWYFPKEGSIKPILIKYWTINNNFQKDGLSVEKFYTGKIYCKQMYVNGKKHGIYEEYWENGQMKLVTNYDNNEQHGIVKEYSETGFITKLYNMSHGKKHGRFESWYNKDQKMDDWYYLQDKNDYTKQLRTWFDSGKIKTEYLPLDEKDAKGRQIIKVTKFHANGLKKMEVKYVENIFHKHGIEPIEYPFNVYYADGTIEGSYTQVGVNRIKIETFYASGKKQNLYYTTLLGMQHGMFASWHQNGIFNELCMHKNDELCDEYAKWDKDGILIRYGKYINGKFVSEDLI